MNRKNYFKTFSTLFMLVMLAFGCQPVSGDNNGTSNSDSNSEKTFTITFDANGGTGEMKALTVKSGKSAELPANTFTKEGYDFSGWVKDKTSTAADYADKASIEPKENVTLYALWKAKKITITFDVNGGTEATPAAIEATAGLVELPKMGGKFSHWNTKADGSGESYQENGIFTANTTLYAIYLKAGEYKITYLLDGGVNNPENPFTYTEGQFYRIKAPTREGYGFVGWKDKNGDVSKYVYITINDVGEDLEFTAVWAKNKYKIIYHSNCDELEDVIVEFAPEEKVVEEIRPFSRDEYMFAGYYANDACTEELSKKVYRYGSIFVENATGDIHLYAGWTAKVYVYDLKIKVTNLPDEVKALSMWGTPNEWKLENIQEEKDLYIAEVKDGTAEFLFDKFNVAIPLWCQFVPMTSKDMEMNNSTWWQTAFSGSSTYANAENNLVYDFAKNTIRNKMELTLDVAKVYGSLEKIFERRFTTENYSNAFKTGVTPGKYQITYNDDKFGNFGYSNTNVTSFDEDDIVILTKAYCNGYKFLGWYEDKAFSGEPITGWAAGEKTADVELWAKWNEASEGDSDKVIAFGGKGIYSYTVNIEDISYAWGGNKTSPAFAIMLLTDEQLKACIDAATFKVATVAKPEYWVGAYGNMKIADTSNTGNYAVYGSISVNDTYKYYTGVAATITDTTFTVTVDMTKLVNTDLKALFAANVDGIDEAVMTNGDIVDLTSYKPYVLALGQQIIDADNYQMSAWSADLMKMTVGAEFPANLTKAAPVIPTCKDLNCIVGTMTNWEHTQLTNNAVDFTATEEDGATDVVFAFTNGSWDFKARGVEIAALDTEYKLVEDDDQNITFANGVLTAGNEYTATLRVAGAHEAYVKVTEVITGVITAANVENYISGLSEGEHTVAVTGAITSDTISAIKTALRSNSGAKINLDLSQTTGLTEIGESAFYNCSNLISIIIPNGVTLIGDSAFSNCSNLTNVVIPDSVVSIDFGVFFSCSNLTNITIPDNVTFIGKKAFMLCNNLTSLTVTDGNTTYKGYENCIYTKDGQTLVAAAGDLTNITILDGTLSISDYVFANNNNLTNVTIPDSVASIGESAFDSCSNLIDITIPNSVTFIGDSAFYDCTSLTSIKISDNVTSINGRTFKGCNSLTSVTIPDGVTSIGEFAFYDCTSLTEINYSGSEEQWKAITIGDNNDSLKNATVNYNYTGE